MTAEACIKLLREIKDAAFATVDEEGHPQVRIIDVMIAEGEKLYFCTERGKDFYRQLIANEYTAITRDEQRISDGEAFRPGEKAFGSKDVD